MQDRSGVGVDPESVRVHDHAVITPLDRVVQRRAVPMNVNAGHFRQWRIVLKGRIADCGERPGAGDDLLQAVVASELASRYFLYTDGRDPRRPVRYVAVARNLDVRPYAVVTPDLRELRAAMADGRQGHADGE
jgi:hypothetical protein